MDEYVTFDRQGFLIVRGLVPRSDVEELRQHTEDLMSGRVVVPGVEPPPATATPVERAQHYLRIHMLHRKLSPVNWSMMAGSDGMMGMEPHGKEEDTYGH